MNGQTQPALQRPPGYGQSQQVQPPPTERVFPTTYRPKRRRRSICLPCCFCLCMSLLVLLLILVAAGGVFYLLFDPKLPAFHVKSLNFRRFNVTVNPDGGGNLDSEAVLGIESLNPNRALRLIYAESEVTLSVDDWELGSASVPGFTQEKKNVTMLRFTIQSKNMMIDAGTGKKLMAGYRSKNLAFSTEVETGFGLGVVGWNTGTLKVKVLCNKVSLKEIENGGMPKCKLNVLNWIDIPI